MGKFCLLDLNEINLIIFLVVKTYTSLKPYFIKSIKKVYENIHKQYLNTLLLKPLVVAASKQMGYYKILATYYSKSFVSST